jgi:hypothetical protein
VRAEPAGQAGAMAGRCSGRDSIGLTPNLGQVGLLATAAGMGHSGVPVGLALSYGKKGEKNRGAGPTGGKWPKKL